MRTKLAVMAAAAAVSGCATWGPTWSEISGNRYNLAEMNTSPTIINQIDGNSAFAQPTPRSPIKVEPGTRRLALTAVPLSPGWTGGTQEEYMDLVAEPCKRYFIAARFDNRLGRQFTPFVDGVETIAGCKLPSAAAK